MPCKAVLWQLPQIRNKCCHKWNSNFSLLFRSQLLHIRNEHNVPPNSIEPVKLAYKVHTPKETTDKAPLIVMHGLFGWKTNWDGVSKFISAATNRKIIVVDARNHGLSPHSENMTYKHMAQDIVQLCHDLSIDKAICVGHSMGGSTMMYLALHFPELIEKLVVVDMSPVRTSPNLDEINKYIEVMMKVKLERQTKLKVLRQMVGRSLYHVGAPPVICEFLVSNLVPSPTGNGYIWRFNLPVIAKEFNNIATFPSVESRIFSGPTLFIAGGESNYITPDHHDGIKKLFPAAEITYVPNANHWVHFSRPHVFVSTLADFVNND